MQKKFLLLFISVIMLGRCTIDVKKMDDSKKARFRAFLVCTVYPDFDQ